MHFPVLRGVALLIFVLLATSFDSFSQHNSTTTDPQITQKIRALSRAFDDAVNNNDAAAVAALFTEDAVLVSDRGPIHGRKAIENWYSSVFRDWHPRNHIGTPDGNDPHVSCFSGDEAWETGEWSETEQARPGRECDQCGADRGHVSPRPWRATADASPLHRPARCTRAPWSRRSLHGSTHARMAATGCCDSKTSTHRDAYRAPTR